MLGKHEDIQMVTTFVVFYQVLPNLQNTNIFNFEKFNAQIQNSSFYEIYENKKQEGIEKDRKLTESKNIT